MKLALVLCSALLIFGTLSFADATQAQNSESSTVEQFIDVPTDHWAYQAVNKLREAGIMVGYPDYTYDEQLLPAGSWEYTARDTLMRAGILIVDWTDPEGMAENPAYTRRGFALMIARFLRLMTPDVRSNSDLAPYQKRLKKMLTNNPAGLQAMKSLVVEFRPELAQLGQDVPKAVAWLDAIKKPAEGLKQK